MGNDIHLSYGLWKMMFCIGCTKNVGVLGVSSSQYIDRYNSCLLVLFNDANKTISHSMAVIKYSSSSGGGGWGVGVFTRTWNIYRNIFQ